MKTHTLQKAAEVEVKWDLAYSKQSSQSTRPSRANSPKMENLQQVMKSSLYSKEIKRYDLYQEKSRLAHWAKKLERAS